MQVLVLVLLISLVYDATKHFRSRRTFLTGVVSGTVLFAAISLLYHMHETSMLPGNFRYMTPWTRDLNFFVAILDLAIWALIIASQHKDRKLLLATGGLGIQFTGTAIGQALRDMSPDDRGYRRRFRGTYQPRTSLHLVAGLSRPRKACSV